MKVLHTALKEQNKAERRRKRLLTVYELVLFAMLGALMFGSKVLMDALPNVHLVGMFIMVFTLVFRAKALIPIYIYVILVGVYSGFAWWLPNIYTWAVLWGITMLLPRKMPTMVACIVYPAVCCLHGLIYGTMSAPVQALMFGLNFKQMIAWIITGLPWDAIHGVGNLCAGMLVLPLSKVLKKACNNIKLKIR